MTVSTKRMGRPVPRGERSPLGVTKTNETEV
jgi:hypothetical protein